MDAMQYNATRPGDLPSRPGPLGPRDRSDDSWKRLIGIMAAGLQEKKVQATEGYAHSPFFLLSVRTGDGVVVVQQRVGRICRRA